MTFTAKMESLVIDSRGVGHHLWCSRYSPRSPTQGLLTTEL